MIQIVSYVPLYRLSWADVIESFSGEEVSDIGLPE